jgi:N-acetylneuraminate synthase/N,N'-diacetyllegionaminate synthase
MKRIRIGTREVGDGAPCLLVAEVGINHNGDMELAHRAIDAAAEAGADAVKFQNYRTEDFLSDRSLTYEYVSQGKRIVESQWEMFKRCELRADALTALREHCDRNDVIFFSTPTSEQGLEDLVRVGVALLKNGSDYLVHLPLIRAMARTRLTTVISTGMATVEDIDDAVQAFRDAGGGDLVLLHCTSAYPTPPQEVNLRRIPALRARFDCHTGLSDHSEGTVAAIGAVALGACMIEKHFTLDRNLPGPDHRFSSDPEEFRRLAAGVRTLEAQLGTSEIGPTKTEAAGRLNYRLSCVAVRDLDEGHTIGEADLVFRRPGTGVPPKYVDRLVGRPLARPIAAGQAIHLGDLR